MRLRLAVACALYASAANAAPGDYFVYAPQPVTPEASAASGPAGVVVKEITIRRGDTLSAISRAFTGRASYYPQILLFNQISDPDMIYAGTTLRVPVAHSERKEKDHGVPEAHVRPELQPVVEPRRTPGQQKEQAPQLPGRAVDLQEVKGEQKLYEKAVKAYRGSTCSDALPLLDSFLAQFPESPHAPDAALLRADCHLRLARQPQP